MISTIKGKIIFFITLVMVACTVVNIYFTNRDVGHAMLDAQEKSALNILHSLELIIEGDYSNLLSDKMEITLASRNQLKNMAIMIESVFREYSDSVKDGLSQAEAVNHSLGWVTSAPFQGISYHIIDRDSRILVSSNKNLTNEAYGNLRDIKNRDISQVMRFGNLPVDGDYAAFRIDNNDEQNGLLLAFFLPLERWEYTIATSIDISNIEAEAQRKKDKIVESIADFSKQLNITKNGFVYLYGTDNNILIPPPEHIENSISGATNTLTGNTIHDDIAKALESGVSKLHFVSSDDDAKQTMIAYCNYFKPLKWYTSVVVPLVEINSPARNLVVRQSLILVTMFMVGLVAIFIVVNRIASPINLLSSYARKLPEMDFTRPIVEDSPIDDLPEKYKDEVGDLASSFILMRQELSKNVRELISVAASKQKMESELNIAREIQLGMVPVTFPAFPERDEFDLYATLLPAREIGGDLYDFFMIDDEHLCFALGDVSDKGIPAALFMMVTRTLIRTFGEKGQTPSEIILNINNSLSSDNPRMMFVTLILGILNIKTGEIIYANGGHNPPIITSDTGGTVFIQGLNEPLVGAVLDVSYTDSSFILSPGDSFFLYTDGVNEAMNSDGRQYSDRKLLKEVERNRNKSSSEVVQAVLDSVKGHSQTAPQSDDIAMLMIRYNGTADIQEQT